MFDLKPHGIDAAAYVAALRADERETRITVQVLDPNGNIVGELSGTADRDSIVQSGGVTFDSDADIDRALELVVIDPDRALMFEADVVDGALWADRFVRVFYGLRLADRSWADVPVFTGRLNSYGRSGDEVTLSGVGPEADHLAPALLWTKLHIARRTEVDVAIRRIMTPRGVGAGVTRYAMTPVSRRTTKTLDLAPTVEPWKVVQKLARDADRHVFFDGHGFLRLRPVPGSPPRFTFSDDIVTTGPGVNYDMAELRNIVRVIGKDPEGAKTRPPVATATLQPTDPFNPKRLGPTGYPLRLVEVIQSDAVSSTREATQMAERVLAQRVRQVVSAEFTCAPIPHIEPLDVVRIDADGVDVQFVMRKWTLPLDGSEMSVGATKAIRVRRETT